MSYDSLKKSLFELVLQAIRSSDEIDYRAFYAATVVSSDGNTATVLPDDMRLRPNGGPLTNRPVRRPNGWTSIPAANVRCMIGWDGGREDRSFVLLGWDGNGSSATTTIDVDATLNLGDNKGQSLCTQTLAAALATFADACKASTDATLSAAAMTLSLVLGGPAPAPLSPLVVTRKTKAS